MKSSLYLALDNPKRTRKTVRISSQTQEKELSPEAKKSNKENNFSKRERLNTISTIHSDQDFKDYLAERRTGMPVKEYRSKVLNTLKNRDKLLSEIRKLKTRKSKKSPSPIQKSKQKEDLIHTTHTKKDSKKRIQPQLLFTSLPAPSKNKKSNKTVKNTILFLFGKKESL
jgi:hypothetical protein